MFLLILNAIALGQIYNVSAQDTSKVQYSNYEKFVNGSGRLIKTVTARAESVADADVSVLIATDIQDNTTFKSVTLNQTKSFLLSTYFIGALSIDLEELPDFIKALIYIQSQIDGAKP